MRCSRGLWLVLLLALSPPRTDARRPAYPEDDENAGDRMPFKRARAKRDMADKFKDMTDKPAYKGDAPVRTKGMDAKKPGKKKPKKAKKPDTAKKPPAKKSPKKSKAQKEEVEVGADGQPAWAQPPTRARFMDPDEEAAHLSLREGESRRAEEQAAEADQRRRDMARDELEHAEIDAGRKQQAVRPTTPTPCEKNLG